MKKLLLLPVFTALLFVESSLACSCANLGENFFETVSLHNIKVQSGEYPKSLELTVVSAEVDKYLQLRSGPEPTEMLLNISGVVQGSLDENTLIVQGDNGFSCMPYVTAFPIGKKFLFALNKYENKFYISSCGYYSTEIQSK